MKCPHCLVEFHPRAEEKDIGDDVNGLWKITKYNCPNPSCKQIILFLKNHEGEIDVISNRLTLTGEIKTTLIHPRGISRAPLSTEVPNEFTKDYKEACLVLPALFFPHHKFSVFLLGLIQSFDSPLEQTNLKTKILILINHS
ncbi:unnamed protein product, partial [marine sediment metagenome]